MGCAWSFTLACLSLKVLGLEEIVSGAGRTGSNWTTSISLKESSHHVILQQRRNSQLSSEMVAEFIRTMRRLLTPRGSLQPSCIVCRRQLPSRWMVILCQACWYELPGGGGRDQLTNNGTEIIHFLHQLVETIHKKRLQGDYSIPCKATTAFLVWKLTYILLQESI